MRIRRCAVLLIEPREELDFEFERLLSGGNGLRSRLSWQALAPHLEHAVEIDDKDVLALGSISRSSWASLSKLGAQHGGKRIRRLLKKGLLIAETALHGEMRDRDASLRTAHWHAPAAALHLLGRWEGVTSGEDAERAGLGTMEEMIAVLGEPPAATVERSKPARRRPLNAPQLTPLDQLLQQRVTCRNFHPDHAVSERDFTRLLHRVFGIQGRSEISPGTSVVKKNCPSGGGLHPIDAYLVVRNVSGIPPGLYHYQDQAHALEPVGRMRPGALRRFASLAMAGQEYLADAAVLVVLSARFGRTQWKYRNHSKAYRAVLLEAGHISQTVYLTATEFGLGAFVSAAINEKDIERAFGLDPFVESPVAVCGFGPRADVQNVFEFDPQHKVWPAAD